MFLCLQLLSRRWTPGGQWIGKNRRVVKLSRTQKLTAAQKKRDIQKVLVQLSIPYLTNAEERGHSKERKYEDYKKWRERVRQRCGGNKNITSTPFPQIQAENNRL